MRALKVIGLPVSIIAITMVSLAIMVAMAEVDPGDGSLIAIAIAACIATLAWGTAGARLLPVWLYLPLFSLALGLGIPTLIDASSRYPSFSPYLVGSVATAVFVIIGCAASSRSVQPLNASLADDAPDRRNGDLLLVASISLFVGALFFQPAIVLLNGQADARPPLVLQGTITRMYQTHGKGAANYIVLSGPAAAYSSTGTAGEFAMSDDAYSPLEVGDQRCLVVHHGLMRFGWWSITGCWLVKS